MKGSGNPHYGRKRVETACPICGEEFAYYPSMGRRVCCSVPCAAEYRRRVFVGERNAQWRGGDLPYYGPNWRVQRDAALCRDSYTCQRCGKGQEDIGREPDVHHVKPFRVCASHLEANRLENLICLCPDCHRHAEHESREHYGLPDYDDGFVPPDDMLTPTEAAAALGLTTWAVYDRIQRGQLLAINICAGIPSRKRPRYVIPRDALRHTPKPRYSR